MSLPGNPADKELWARLDEVLARRFPHRTVGSLAIAVTCIDSGNWSKLVYEFCGPRFHKQIFAIKGSSDPSAPIWPRRPSRPKDGRQSNLFSVGSTAAKEIVVNRLGIVAPGPGFCHFPAGRDFDYFQMLLAEKPIRKYVNGVAHRIWTKPVSARNEALDCRIYCLAALHALRTYSFNLDGRAAKVAAMPHKNASRPEPPKPPGMGERYAALQKKLGTVYQPNAPDPPKETLVQRVRRELREGRLS